MSRAQSLIRWSGLPLLLAAIMFPIYTLLHPVEETPAAILASSWAAIHSLWLAGTILTLFGLVGLYARQMEQSGSLGAFAFVLTFTGMSILIAFAFFDSYIVPVLARVSPLLTDPAGPIMTAPTYSGLMLGCIGLLTVGPILFAVATFRAHVLPRWGGLLFGIGTIVFEAGQGLGPVWDTLCALVYSVGLMWLGLALWLPPQIVVRQPRPAIS